MTEEARPRCYFCPLLCPLGVERTPAGRFLPQYPTRVDGLRGLCGRGHTTCELLGHPERRNLALVRTGGAERSMPLAEALAELAALLKGVWDPAAAALVVDGSLPAEVIIAAQLFAEECLEGAAWSVFLPPCDQALLRGLGSGTELPTTEELARADVTVAVGDPFVSHPIIAGPILKAKLTSRDAALAVLDSVDTVTAGFATQPVTVPPGLEAWALARVAQELGGSEDALGPLLTESRTKELDETGADIGRLAEALRAAERPVLLLAPEPTRTGAPAALAVAAKAVAQAAGAKVLPLTCYGNARPACALSSNLGATPLAELLRRLRSGALRALMILGGDPSATVAHALGPQALGELEVLAVAESLPTMTGERASVILPLALAAESGGTVVDCFGRVGVAEPLALPPRGATVARALLSALARELAVDLPKVSAPEASGLELAQAPSTKESLEGMSAPAAPEGDERWLLGTGSTVHYDAGTLTRFASWARVTEPTAHVAVSTGLARTLGVKPGDELQLRGAGGEVRLECTVREHLDDGTVVVSGNFPQVRRLFAWPVPEKGDVLPSGPATVAVEAACPVTSDTEKG
jgi:predicted molibdopterin-dependent oxidoreductase YjgC